jgi:hypothetical protein
MPAGRCLPGLSKHWLANGLRYAIEERPEGACRMTLLAVRLDTTSRREKRLLRREIDQRVAASVLQASRIQHLIEDPGVVRSVFEDIALIYWLTEPDEDPAEDVQQLETGLCAALPAAVAENRLAFSHTQGEFHWSQAPGWKTDAFGLILAALSRADGKKPGDEETC